MERCRQFRPIRWLRWLYTLISRVRNLLRFDIRLFSTKKKRDMAAAQGFGGEFWLTDRPTVHEPGMLEVGSMTAPMVKTVGALRSPWREESRIILPDGRMRLTSNFVEEELGSGSV